MGFNLPFQLLVEVTFHFSEKRLRFLFESIRGLSEMPLERLHVVVSTNTDDAVAVGRIREVCAPLFDVAVWGGTGGKTFSIESYPNLEDPWLLPWCHKHLIVDEFLAVGSSFTHFIHIEDDLLLSLNNLLYFARYSDELRTKGLIPAFQRIEYYQTANELRLLDQVGLSDFESRAKTNVDGFTFVNPDYPHQAMFILDVAHAREYVGSRSFDRESSGEVRASWGLCERSAMGLCFESPPEGYWSRYVVPVDPKTLRTPSWSWIYHLPNNYAGNSRTPHGKTPPDAQFFLGNKTFQWSKPTLFQNLVWKIRQLPSRFLNGPRKTGHDLVPVGSCGMCGHHQSHSSQCTRSGCPVKAGLA